MKNDFLSILSMRVTNRITKYLGFRMFQGSPQRADFEMIYDRISCFEESVVE